MKIKQFFLMAVVGLMAAGLTSCNHDLSDHFGVSDNPFTVTSISIAPTTLDLTVGNTGQLTAKVDPAGTAVTWSSDKEEIATVDANGMVTAVAVGTAIITAKAGDKTATCEVTVLPTLSTPLTVEAITAGKITVTGPQPGMQYSLNGGAKTAVTTTPIDVAAGKKVEFYGNGTSITKYEGTKIGGDGDGFKCKVYGNIMSLVDEEGFATNTELPANYTFKELFKDNVKLTDASGLLLPATTLKAACYWGMFSGCTGLTTVPEKLLPATTLASQCYQHMFYGCTGLTTVPEKLLPATTLANHCYRSMFENCTGLTTLPEKLLPATEMKSNCYLAMFQGCTGLTTLPEKLLPATVMATNCYSSMFNQCTGLTTLPEKLLPATTLANQCYQSLFQGCTSLTTVPEKLLPATTLAQRCYYEMFRDCTNLTTAPKLPAPATNLADGCYIKMFYQCSSLTTAYVKAAYNAYSDNMFFGCVADGAVLHTTSTNQGSWNTAISDNNWSTWTTANDWTD